MSENTALVVAPQTEYRMPTILEPLVDPLAAKEAMDYYERLKASIARESDKQRIGNSTYLKKSFWRRLGKCFGVSAEIVREERSIRECNKYCRPKCEGQHVAYAVIARAVAHNGQYMDGDGFCVDNEKLDKEKKFNIRVNEHVCRGTAVTRAKNRAISDLVGGGEVSAEEMPDYDENVVEAEHRPAPAPRPKPEPETTPFEYAESWKVEQVKAGLKGRKSAEIWDILDRLGYPEFHEANKMPKLDRMPVQLADDLLAHFKAPAEPAPEAEQSELIA
jgi:hypothetical protein